jgi:hypothetical protein
LRTYVRDRPLDGGGRGPRATEFLDAQRRRLERLLGTALRVAVGGTDTTPEALLGVICQLDGTNPSRAAFLEERAEAA